MTSSLTLRVAADVWQDAPQFIVSVDGQKVSGVLTTSASHADGQWQDITVTGDFSANPGTVSVAFINDAYGGWGQDRNLYVQSLTLNRQTLSASTAKNTGGSIANGVANILSNGAVTFKTAGLSTATAAPVTVAPATAAATSSLVVRVAADSWTGDPQFTVTVDGKQVGGTYTATASHANGQWQDITVTGSFSATPGAVGVTFLNDAYGGWNQDRNLYVHSVTINGKTTTATGATNTGGAIANGVANLLSNGTVTFAIPATKTAVTAPAPTAPVATPPATTTPTTVAPVATTPIVTAPVVTAPVTTTPTSVATTATTNSLVLRVAGDAWAGDPQFTVTVDGKQIGGTYTATAVHGNGQWQDVTVTGPFGAPPASVSVAFINDAYGGWNQDRNLYVQSLTLNGVTLSAAKALNTGGSTVNGVANVLSNGAVIFDTSSVAALTIPAATVPVTTTPAAPVTTTTTPPSTTSPVQTPAAASSLVLHVAADSWAGDPQFTVSVDGKQVGGTYTATAAHGAGQWQDITVSGAFAASPGTVSVSFINDAYGGWNQDRNLYVQSVTVNNKTVTADNATNTGGAIVGGIADVLSNGTVTFNLSAAAATTGSSTTVTTPASTATSTSGLQLLGVNLAGAEFGSSAQPGTYGTNYTYPTDQEIDYYAAKGLNVIRLPFLWERLQTSLGGPLNVAELARIDDIVNYASSKSLKVVLDPHDYGSGFGSAIGTGATTNAAFADFWGKLAGHFAGNSQVIFGLMNEPHVQSATDWLQSANAAIQSIRSAGAHQEILVPGAYWDTAATWTTSDNASVVGTGVKDPDNNYAFEVHQYLDADNSGTHSGVSSDTIGVDRLQSITSWAESHDAKLFLGEFGVSQDTASLSALDKILSFMGSHSDVWQGGTYWAGGPWWYGSNIYGVEPTGLGTSKVTDQPQMAILTNHVSGSAS